MFDRIVLTKCEFLRVNSEDVGSLCIPFVRAVTLFNLLSVLVCLHKQLV